MSSSRFHRRVRGSLLRIAVLVVMAVTLVAGTARAGSTYFFCDAMVEQRAEPCCERHQRPASSATPTDCDCCHPVMANALPAGIATDTPYVSPSPLLPTHAAAPTTRRAAHARLLARPARARRRPPREVDRLRLMVFLN